MSESTVLVAGIGNVFLGDDGFGVEVARRLREMPGLAGARVVDFGTRGHDLAFALSRCEAAVLVDAIRRGGAPGTLYVVEPTPGAPLERKTEHGHSLDPVAALELARALGSSPARLLLVGCEPESFGGAEGRLGLSPSVEAAVPEAVRLAAALARGLALKEEPCTKPA